MPSARRTRIFKIILRTFFVVCILFISTKGYDLYEAISNHGFEIDEQVNKRNVAYAKLNRFGFTDKERVTQKPKGVFRIAVLGDSFIWGDGLPYEKVWSHKLESKLLAAYDSVEVISWGKNGWSTLDEFNFYKDHGHDYDIDLLIIGWVENDPDVGKIKLIDAGDSKKEFLWAYKIYPPLAKMMLNNNNGDSYSRWLENIYCEQNLQEYQKVLSDFHAFLSQNNTSALIVMTPSASMHGHTPIRFDKIKPHILQANFTCLDLLPIAQKNLEHYSSSILQANAVNGHPGDIMTEEFANDVKLYLEQNNYLSKLHKRGL